MARPLQLAGEEGSQGRVVFDEEEVRHDDPISRKDPASSPQGIRKRCKMSFFAPFDALVFIKTPWVPSEMENVTPSPTGETRQTTPASSKGETMSRIHILALCAVLPLAACGKSDDTGAPDDTGPNADDFEGTAGAPALSATAAETGP